MLEHAFTRQAQLVGQYQEGEITEGDRLQWVVDTWAEAANQDRERVRRHSPPDDPLEMFAAATIASFSPERLRAMRGLQTKISGEIIERPLTRSVAEGFDPHDAVILWASLRSDVMREDRPDDAVAALLHDADAVLSDVVVAARDCRTARGVWVGVLELTPRDAPATLAPRVTGRVLAEDVVTRDGRTLAAAGTLVTPLLARTFEAEHVPGAAVRDAVACEALGGVCARCLGADPDDATWAQPGDAVGARAAFGVARAARDFDDRDSYRDWRRRTA